MSTDMRPSQEPAASEKGNSSMDNSNTASGARESGGGIFGSSAPAGSPGGNPPGGSGPGGSNETPKKNRFRRRDEGTDIIGTLVGRFGRWQLMMTLILSVFSMPNTFHIISPVFQSARKDFWCKRPANLANVPIDVWRNISRSDDNCHQVVYDWNKLTPADAAHIDPQKFQHGDNAQIVECTDFEFDFNDNLGNTWTSEWNLVCKKEYLLTIAEMVFLVGVAVGGVIAGYLSDRFGRKKILFTSASLQIITATSLYFVTSFELYLILRCWLGFVSVAVVYAGMIMAIEFVDGWWRLVSGMIQLVPLSISYAVISGMAYLTQDFRKLQLLISLPGIVALPLWPIIPESPRWLLVKGRVDEVAKIVERTAKFNKRTLPPNFESLLKPPPQDTTTYGLLGLFRTRYMCMISFCFFVIWFTTNLVYYGILLNMSSFGGNVYINMSIAGLVELPAGLFALFLITRCGKRTIFCGAFLVGGVVCGCAAIVEGIEYLVWLKISFLMFAKFIISTGNMVMPVYTAELYPTAIRNAGVGACNASAGVALILTPYLALLNQFESHLMMVVLTISSLVSGVTVFFIPKTPPKPAEEEEKQ